MKTQLLTIKPTKLGAILCLILFTFLSCSTESTDDGGGEPPVSEDKLNEINNFLASLSSFSQADESGTTLIGEEAPERDTEDNTLECVVKNYKVAPGYSEMLLLDPTSDVIYPGAMLKGESIPTGEYIGINGGRAPITLSVSLENLNGKPSTIINNPRIDTVREGVKDMLQQGVTGSTAAKINFTTEEVYSQEHLSVALGASYSKGKNSVSASFDFSKTTKKYRYVVKYLQIYYTIDLTLPPNNNPGALFTDVPNLDSTSPVIVSSVKYGRMLLYSVETDSELTETNAAFSAAFNGGNAGGSGEYDTFWSSSIVKALVIGGSGGDAANVVSGPAGVFEYITSGGDYSAASPGLPLGYTLRYIKKDFPIAKVVLSSEYAIRSCDLAYPQFKITLLRISTIDTPGGTEGSHLEVHGNAKGRLNVGGSYVKSGGKDIEVSWSRSESGNLKIDKGSPHTVNDSETITLYRPNYETDYVYLSGSLKDKDAFGNDNLGSRTLKINLNDINKNRPSGKTYTHRLNFDEKADHEVRVYYDVLRVK
ncbi:thiol-activated cytolysin family protein [Algibacter aquimarinus]|uniref:Thiol-activated cytolysin n=1 Tax=Algibacter aquimarinus TaxID=1136748 RepID=A0ABP9HNS7_9FLAO